MRTHIVHLTEELAPCEIFRRQKAAERAMGGAEEAALLGGEKSKRLHRGLQRLRQLFVEQTPSTLLLLSLLFGVVAGLVAYVYSK